MNCEITACDELKSKEKGKTEKREKIRSKLRREGRGDVGWTVVRNFFNFFFKELGEFEYREWRAAIAIL